jgi:hypothetical protein
MHPYGGLKQRISISSEPINSDLIKIMEWPIKRRVSLNPSLNLHSNMTNHEKNSRDPNGTHIEMHIP